MCFSLSSVRQSRYYSSTALVHEFPILQEIISVEPMVGLTGLTFNVIYVLFYLCTKETPKISVSDVTHPVNCNVTHIRHALSILFLCSPQNAPCIQLSKILFHFQIKKKEFSVSSRLFVQEMSLHTDHLLLEEKGLVR